MSAKRKPTTAATRERRRHQALRDRLWERVLDRLWDVQSRQGPGTDGTHLADKAHLSEARFLIKALRDTGAK